MESEIKYFNCGNQLLNTLNKEIEEIKSIVNIIKWNREFSCFYDNKIYKHQAGYNKTFGIEFTRLNWERCPILRKSPKLIGDFRKELVFVEVQFGNSAALYRDFYKFQYGLLNGLLSLSVLIVPKEPKKFFPTRTNSVRNMANYSLACKCLTILPINVPIILIGLIQNEM